ncbi:Imm1 family immunity protein [Kitasatospora sp. NPDC004615]|uniref:Imm1 family immunity protein n=1 Tax=Kitasatospora sp. NPDC004615 TaxID=3364017 RepID=UPI003680EF52
MILEIWYDREARRPADAEETETMVAEALRAAAGSQAAFCFREPGAEHRSAELCVTVDEAGEYGALSWLNVGHKGGIHDWLWLSDNPHPSGAEPALVADDHTGAQFDPASVLPMPLIAAAVHEYCRGGTGERPPSVDWVTGEYNGYRNDDGKGGIPED